jgi:hypothetical protein
MDFKAAIEFVARVNPDLNITNAITFANQLVHDGGYDWNSPEGRHNALVDITVNNPAIINLLRTSQKIPAIKKLRGLTEQHGGGVSGLKECKDAVEDSRVNSVVGPLQPRPYPQSGPYDYR